MLPTEEETHVCIKYPKLLGPSNESENNAELNVNVKLVETKVVLSTENSSCAIVAYQTYVIPSHHAF